MTRNAIVMLGLGLFLCASCGESGGADDAGDSAAMDSALTDVGGEDSRVGSDGATGDDTGTADDASADSSTDGASDTSEPPADASGIVCMAGGGGAFPTFGRACTEVTDCVAVLHQTDCCGNMAATGIRADEEAAFNAAERTCREMYPRCRCPVGPTVADDGTMGLGEDFVVECAENVCTTTFPID